MQDAMPRWKRVLRSLLTALASLALVGVFYVAVVMGQPQDSGVKAPEVLQDQPLLDALPAALHISSEKELAGLSEAFPAPVMHAAYGQALIFVSGECRDVAFEGGLGRIVTLTYRTEDFDTLTVTSIYPARALSLIGKEDRTFTGKISPTLDGLRTVPMKNSTTIRLHAQGPEALYVFTAPITADATLRQWTSSMQRYQAE